MPPPLSTAVPLTVRVPVSARLPPDWLKLAAVIVPVAVKVPPVISSDAHAVAQRAAFADRAAADLKRCRSN